MRSVQSLSRVRLFVTPWTVAHQAPRSMGFSRHEYWSGLGDNIQPWHTHFPIWNQSVVPCPVLTVSSWPAYRFLRRQVRWSGVSISWTIFHSLLWPTQMLWHSRYSRNRCFSGTLLFFSMIQWMLAIWSLAPLPFLNPTWTSGISQLTHLVC